MCVLEENRERTIRKEWNYRLVFMVTPKLFFFFLSTSTYLENQNYDRFFFLSYATLVKETDKIRNVLLGFSQVNWAKKKTTWQSISEVNWTSQDSVHIQLLCSSSFGISTVYSNARTAHFFPCSQTKYILY